MSKGHNIISISPHTTLMKGPLHMKYYQFIPTRPLIYHYSGKFKAPNTEWMHLTRQLTDFELIVVTDGILYIAADDHKYQVSTGEYLLMAPICHQYGYRAGDCTFYWLHFGDTGLIQPLFTLPPSKPNALPPENNTADFVPPFPEQGILPAMERIIVLMKQLQDSDRRYGSAALNNFLSSTIVSELAAQTDNRDRYAHAKETQLFSNIRDYIELHISEQLRVRAIADYFGYNEKYLSTMFRQWAGVSLKQYILQAKMDHAKAELSDTNLSISQIGYNLGYNDPHNFTNTFRKLTGLTPGAYRESYSKRRLNQG